MKTRKQYTLKNDRSDCTKYIGFYVSPAFFKKIKGRALIKDLTMSEYIRELIEKDLKGE